MNVRKLMLVIFMLGADASVALGLLWPTEFYSRLFFAIAIIATMFLVIIYKPKIEAEQLEGMQQPEPNLQDPGQKTYTVDEVSQMMAGRKALPKQQPKPKAMPQHQTAPTTVYQCPFCSDKRFTKEPNLQQHIAKEHWNQIRVG